MSKKNGEKLPTYQRHIIHIISILKEKENKRI